MPQPTTRFPTLHRDPTLPVVSAARQTGVQHEDRLEVVRTPAPRRRAVVTGGRHRRPVERPPATGWPAGLGTVLVLLLLTVLAAIVSTGDGLPAPVAAIATVAVLGLVGAPLLRLSALPLPDPLTRAALSVTAGLVLLSALVAVLDVVRPDARPGALTGLLVVDALVLVLHLVSRRISHRDPRPARPVTLRRLRRLLPGAPLVELPVLVLPVLGWLDATGTAASPRWLRVAVLVAALVLLTRCFLAAQDGARRTVTAVTLYCVALAVLTPVGEPGTAGSPAWTGALARTTGLTADEVTRTVLPALTALVVVVAWLTAERVLGAARAVVVATVVLAVLLAAPSTWGDLPVAAAVLVIVGGRGRHSTSTSASRARRAAVAVLTVGALVNAPSAAVFAAQVCLATLVAVLVGRSVRSVLTLPLALVVAAAVWIATLLHEGTGLGGTGFGGTGLGTAPWTTTTVVVGGLAVLGLVAVLVRRSSPAVAEQEFLVVAVAGVLLEAAATAGSRDGTGVVTQVLVVLAVPAVLGISAGWGLLAGAFGAALDRVPGALLRTPARATRGHRLAPARLTRTAVVALALLTLEYARRAFG